MDRKGSRTNPEVTVRLIEGKLARNFVVILVLAFLGVVCQISEVGRATAPTKQIHTKPFPTKLPSTGLASSRNLLKRARSLFAVLLALVSWRRIRCRV